MIAPLTKAIAQLFGLMMFGCFFGGVVFYWLTSV